jgi:hypothetical protein
MLSVIPEASWAQALSAAVRIASSRVSAEAVLQAVLPRNSIQTSHLNLLSRSEE